MAATTRDQLAVMLKSLDEAMPALLREHPFHGDAAGDFWAAFAGMADVIQDRAAAEDFEWVLAETDRILAAHGVPLEDLTPSDDLPPRR